MSFEIGDTVAVLDEDVTGIIQNISKNEIIIETKDGFLLNFSPSELIIQKKSNEIIDNVFEVSNVNDILKEKEINNRVYLKKTPKKDKAKPAMEVDLHIHKLVKSSKGMTNFDMLNLQLETAKQKLEFAIKKRIQRIVFIHGVGEGVLKLELETLFRRYDCINYYDASYKKYGVGATEVYIYQSKN